MAEKISVGKFINNMDKEDLTSTDLQGVVGNVYAKAIADHKKTTKIADDNLKDKDKETVEFTKSNHDRLKANKDKVAKEVNKDNAKEVKPEGKTAKGVEETKGSAVVESRQVNETAENEFEVVKYKGNQYGIWAKTSKNWMMFGKKADLEKRVKELNAGHKDYKKIDEALLEPGNIYSVLVKELPAEDIDHHDSDLYVRKTPKSTEIINRLTTKSLLSTFKDNIDGDIWYELPFCFSPHFQKEELRKSGKKLNEEKEEYSFEEIIDMMASAEEYEDLYYAAGLIKNDDLRIDVEELIDSCEQDEDDVDTAYSIVTSDLLDNKVNELNVKFLSSDHLNLDDLRAQGGVERVGEEAWKAACSGDTEWIEKIFNDGHLKPNEFRYNKFGEKHSLIMGALRNQQFETAEALKSLGEKILRSEVDEYKSIMAKKTYTDETSEGALDESRLAYYEYRGCKVRETPSTFVAINEHGLNIGESPTAVGAEGIIDDYLEKKGIKTVIGGQPKREGSFAERHPNIKLKKETLKEELSDEEIFDILGIEQENRTNSKHLLSQFRRLRKKYRTDSIWLKGDVGSAVKGKVIGRSNDLAVVESKQVNEAHESKTPYGDTTIEDYVNVNFSGSQEDKNKLIAKMRKKTDGSNYFNGLNMSVKDWEKAGKEFGLTMKRYPVTESKKLKESHNLKRNITNIKFAVKELQKKGYSHEEANDLVLKIFDEHEGDTNRSLEWYLDKVLSKADYNKEYRKETVTESKETSWKVTYDKGRPGGTEEIIKAKDYEEAKQLAAKHANGWGFEVKRVNESKEIKEDWTVFEYTSGSNPYIAKTDKEVKRLFRKYKGKVRKINDTHYEVDDKKNFDWDKPMVDNDPLPFGPGAPLEEAKGKKVYVVIEISRDSDVPKLIGVYNNKSDAEKDAYSEGRRWCNVIETTLKGPLKDESLKEARYNDGVAKGQHIASVDLFSTGVSDEDKKKAKELGHYEIDLDNKVFTRVKGNHWLGHWRIESYPRDTWEEVEKTARNIMKDGNFKEVSNDKYIEIQKDWENKRH